MGFRGGWCGHSINPPNKQSEYTFVVSEIVFVLANDEVTQSEVDEMVPVLQGKEDKEEKDDQHEGANVFNPISSQMSSFLVGGPRVSLSQGPKRSYNVLCK